MLIVSMDFSDIESFLPFGWEVTHWLLAIAVTLLVLDLFFQTEALSLVSVGVFALYFTLWVDAPLQWDVLVFLGFALLALALYMLFWRKFVLPLVSRLLLRNAVRESVENAPGSVGVFRRIGEACFVEWNGELWAVEAKDLNEFSDREPVLIQNQSNGTFLIAKCGSTA